MTQKPAQRDVEIVKSDCQPRKAELEADAWVDATFEESLDTLVQPVRIRHVMRPGPDR